MKRRIKSSSTRKASRRGKNNLWHHLDIHHLERRLYYLSTQTRKERPTIWPKIKSIDITMDSGSEHGSQYSSETIIDARSDSQSVEGSRPKSITSSRSHTADLNMIPLIFALRARRVTRLDRINYDENHLEYGEHKNIYAQNTKSFFPISPNLPRRSPIQISL